MHDELQEKFELQGDPDHVMNAINRIFGERFKDFRYHMHIQYKKHKDCATTKADPYDTITSYNCEKNCNGLASKKFEDISFATQRSQQELKIRYTGGLKPFVCYLGELHTFVIAK